MFLHIPKTGGSWVTHVLNELDLIHCHLGREHSTYEQHFWYDRFYRDEKVVRNIARRALGWLPKVQPDCYKFCFVREPLDWYVSWWRFMQSLNWRCWGEEGNPYRNHPLAMLNKLGNCDFNTFVANVNRSRPGFVTELYGWYTRPGVHFIGKQEDLVAGMEQVLTELNFREGIERLRQLPRVNESPKDVPVPEWDPAVRRETLRLEYAGYIRYGYPARFE